MCPGRDDELLTTRSAGAEGGAPACDELTPGQVVGERYEIEARVGTGGMGTVYRVLDRTLGETVALKLLHRAPTTEREVERFRREVRLARRITHPNVARIHDLGEVGDLCFLTMEYLPGQTLHDVLGASGPLPEPRVLDLSAQVARGLEAAHRAGVLHRDLKPANVLLAGDERVVLTDFGIARAVGRDEPGGGDLAGTPLYMSPEQLHGRPVDFRSDVYAFGVLLYELLTDHLPQLANTPVALALKRIEEPPADPRERVEVSSELAELVMRCLAVDPGDRPPSASALLAELETLRQPERRPSQTTSRPPFVPMPAADHTLAILPLRYRGAPELSYLGEALAEELIDQLSRTRGLRVLAFAATRALADEASPARIRAELGADALVDGTVQASPDHVRISARLVDTSSGVQRWSDRFDAPAADVLALQEKMGRRVAEALRLEVASSPVGGSLSQRAQELYLQARRVLRTDVGIGERATALLDECLELAPDFEPAIAAHAMASVRAWWTLELRDTSALADRAESSTIRAAMRAPDQPETHLASAMWSTQHGDYRHAASELARAIELAPTFADAHSYLGQIQVEAGRAKEGIERLELALDLDPTFHLARLSLARMAALYGDDEGFDRYLAPVIEALGPNNIPVLSTRLRQVTWRRDLDGYREQIEELERSEDRLEARALAQVGRYGLGEVDSIDDLDEVMSAVVPNPRYRTLTLQIQAENEALRGDLDRAVRTLERATDQALVDIEWLERCPLFEPLAGDPGFERVRNRVGRRAQLVWTPG